MLAEVPGVKGWKWAEGGGRGRQRRDEKEGVRKKGRERQERSGFLAELVFIYYGGGYIGARLIAREFP